MKRRILLLALAAVLAVLSGLALLSYAGSADRRALNGREGKWVLLATGTIPADTTAAQIRDRRLVRQVLMPAETVPSGALSKIEPSLDHLALNAPLQPDQMLMRRQFEPAATPSPTSTFKIPRGKVAVSVALSVAPQVAGNVRPGDDVTVFCMVKVKDKRYPDDMRKFTIVLIPKATVISVGEAPAASAPATPVPTASPSTTATGALSSGLMPDATTDTGTALQRYVVTLAVEQEDAQNLITGAGQNSLYLGRLGAQATMTPAGLDPLGVNPSEQP
jgi:pilus assembly protein CpaB